MEAKKVNRRAFLKGIGLAAGAAALVPVLRPLEVSAAGDFSGDQDRFGMLTDTTRCVGCRACEIACNKLYQLPPPELAWSERLTAQNKRRTSYRSWTVVNYYGTVPDGGKPVYRKVQCMHCNEPACVSACPVAALKKMPEGMVTYNEKVCIGCRYCINTCPFSMLAYEWDDALAPAVTKCIMCYQRVVKEGRMTACAQACPTGALAFGKRSDLLQMARERIVRNPEKYVDHIYGENELGGTGWLYLSAVPFRQLDFPEGLGTQPRLELTRDFLLGVPLVLVMWPALLMGLHQVAAARERRREADAGTPQKK